MCYSKRRSAAAGSTPKTAKPQTTKPRTAKPQTAKPQTAQPQTAMDEKKADERREKNRLSQQKRRINMTKQKCQRERERQDTNTMKRRKLRSGCSNYREQIGRTRRSNRRLVVQMFHFLHLEQDVQPCIN